MPPHYILGQIIYPLIFFFNLNTNRVDSSPNINNNPVNASVNALVNAPVNARVKKPNILFIMVDGLRYPPIYESEELKL